MIGRSLILTALLLLFAGSALAQPIDWTLDNSHSQISFTARHLGFAKVRGEFKKFAVTKATADAKTGKLTALEAEADTASVDTGVAKRDEHLKSDDFLNAAQFPKLKLVVKKITWAGKKFNATVALTLRDVTKDVKMTGELLGVTTVNFGQGPQLRLGYEANGTINRKDFGLKFAAVTEGVAIVSDKVDLHLEAEFSAPPPAPVAKPGAAAAAPAAKPAVPGAVTPTATTPAAAKPAATTPAAAKPAAPAAAAKPATPAAPAAAAKPATPAAPAAAAKPATPAAPAKPATPAAPAKPAAPADPHHGHGH